MKIYSYTNSNYITAKDKFNDQWPIQFLQGFSDFYKTFYNNEIILIEDELTKSIIPIKVFTSKVFKFAQILHAPVNNAIELNANDQLNFLNNLIEFLETQKIAHRLVQPHPFGIMQAVPIGAKSCDFGTYITALNEFDDESLLNTFDVKYKKAVQHAIKNGARCEFGWNVFNDFYSLYSGTMNKAGISIDSKEYFETLRKCLGDQHLKVGVIYDENIPIGGIFILHSKYAALVTHAGSGGESKLYGGVKLLHYEMMKMLRNDGVKYYDFVGVRINSKDESLSGIFRFKKGFGGILKTGFLWKKDITKTPMRLYDFLLSVKNKKGNFKDIIDQEATLNSN